MSSSGTMPINSNARLLLTKIIKETSPTGDYGHLFDNYQDQDIIDSLEYTGGISTLCIRALIWSDKAEILEQYLDFGERYLFRGLDLVGIINRRFSCKKKRFKYFKILLFSGRWHYPFITTKRQSKFIIRFNKIFMNGNRHVIRGNSTEMKKIFKENPDSRKIFNYLIGKTIDIYYDSSIINNCDTVGKLFTEVIGNPSKFIEICPIDDLNEILYKPYDGRFRGLYQKIIRRTKNNVPGVFLGKIDSRILWIWLGEILVSNFNMGEVNLDTLLNNLLMMQKFDFEFMTVYLYKADVMYVLDQMLLQCHHYYRSIELEEITIISNEMTKTLNMSFTNLINDKISRCQQYFEIGSLQDLVLDIVKLNL